MIISFSKRYFSVALLLFIVEVIIALFMNDRFIRPYVGDVLVVALIYCFVKSFIQTNTFVLIVVVWVFSFTIEFIQYLNIIRMLSLEQLPLVKIILGTSFSWLDLLAYSIGCAVLLVAENYHTKHTAE